MGVGKEDEAGKSTGEYGTFQGVANYPPPPPHPHPHHPPPPGGFPQPAPPPGASEPPPYGYQSAPVPGYPIAEGTPVRELRERRLPCCGIGCGWFLFIIGFFLGAIPWYVGVLVLLCNRHRMDQREKPGYVACVIAAVIGTIAIIVGATSHGW